MASTLQLGIAPIFWLRLVKLVNVKLLAVATSQRRLAAHEAHWRGPGMIQNEFNQEKNNIFNEET